MSSKPYIIAIISCILLEFYGDFIWIKYRVKTKIFHKYKISLKNISNFRKFKNVVSWN